jgi:hypothetical protein
MSEFAPEEEVFSPEVAEQAPLGPKVPDPEWYNNEKAFYAAGTEMNSGDSSETNEEVFQNYMQMSKELNAEGHSEAFEQQRALVLNEQRARERDHLITIMGDASIPMHKKEATLNAWAADADERGDDTLADAYRENIIRLTSAQTASEEKRIFQRAAQSDDMEETSKQIQREMNATTAAFSTDLDDASQGFVEVVTPFVDTATRRALMNAALGDDGWWGAIKHFVFAGSSTKNFRKQMLALPPAMREQAHLRMLNVLRDLPGADMKKMHAMQVLMEQPYENWEVWVDNVVSVLDLAILPGIAAKIFRTTARTFGGTVKESSPLKTTLRADPKQGSDVGAAILVDETGEIGKAVDAEVTMMAEELLFPKPIMDQLGDVVDMPRTLLNDIAQKADWTLRTIKNIHSDMKSHGINYYDTEKKGWLTDKLREHEKLAKTNGVELHLPISQAATDGDEILFIARHGESTTSGFDTWITAAQRGKETFGEGNYKVVGYDPVKREIYDPAKGGLREGTQFFVENETRHVFDAYDANLKGWDKSVGRLARHFPNFSSWAGNAISRFDAGIRWGSHSAENVALASQKRMLDQMKTGLKEISLSRKDKAALFRIIEMGGEEGKTFTLTELRNMDKQGVMVKDWEKISKAYYLYRTMQDGIWALENAAFNKQLVKEGRRAISVNGDMKYVTPLNSVETAIGLPQRTFFNPTTGASTHLNKKQLKELYKNGGMIVETRGMVAADAGLQRYTHMVIDGKQSKLTGIPESPLPYIDGYYHRGYKTHFFIDKYNGAIKINGASAPARLGDDALLAQDAATDLNRTNTVSSVELKSEAGEVAARMNAERTEDEILDGVFYRAREGEELSAAYRDQHNLFSQSKMHSRRRGTKALADGNLALATKVDPWDSLQQTIFSTTHSLAYGDYLEAMKARWIKNFGKYTKGQFPNHKGDMVRPTGVAGEEAKHYNAGVALFNHIELMSGTNILSETLHQKMFYYVADHIEGSRFTNALAGKLREFGLKKKTTFTAMKKLPSVLFIWLRPGRQLLLQSGQLAQLSLLDPKLVLSGKIFKDPPLLAAYQWYHLNRGQVKYGLDDDAMKMIEGTLVKMGVAKDVDELRTLREALFDKSGLPGSQDANSLIDSFIKQTSHSTTPFGLRDNLAKVKDVVKFPLRFARKAGFDAGEYMNLAGSWLYAQRKFIRENPKANWKSIPNQKKISAVAREVSYGMTKSGSFGYQRGAAGVTLQFLSVPHKALLSVLPAIPNLKGGSLFGGAQTWTRGETQRIATANLALFGGYSFGLYKVVEEAADYFGVDKEDVPEVVWAAVRGGAVDAGFNTLLQMVFDEKELPDVEFAKGFSPLGERFLPFTDTFLGVLEKPLIEAFLGPFGAVMRPKENFFDMMKTSPTSAFDGRFPRMMGVIGAMLHNPEINTPEEYLAGVNAASQVMSGMSDYWKARFIFEHHKTMSTKGGLGRHTETPSTAALAALFGFGLSSDSASWEEVIQWGDERAAIKDAMRWYADAHLQILRTYEAQGWQGDEDLHRRMLGVSMIWRMWEDRPDIQQVAREELGKILKQHTQHGRDNLITALMEQIQLGDEIGTRTQEKLQSFVAEGAITQEQADNMMQIYEHIMDFSKLPRSTE